ALPARPLPSAPPRRAWVAPWLLARAWHRLPPSWPALARVRPRRRLAVRNRRSRPAPPPQAVVRKAQWRAWATSPRPARRQPGVALYPARPLPGGAWPLPSGLAGTALLPMAARGRHPVRVPQARPHLAPLRHRHRNSPLGPSACIAASNSLTPRPPPPT